MPNCRGSRGSQFWRGLNKIKHGFSWGVVFKVNNGKLTRFWEDVWKGETPLRIAYPKLYDLSNNKSGLVCDFYVDGTWQINFRSSLVAQDLPIWEDLMNQLDGVQFNSDRDEFRWALEKTGQFTTKSMHRWFSHRGVVNKRLKLIWGSRLPMKLKVFLWLITHNRLQTGVELKKRKWKGSATCNICGGPETVDHIFFLLHCC